ncbi:MAG: GNAT family N-acetyltransferase [Geodermatophilaceae bacterium]|nr:GNAT family N-acetyltransferase [Geodermatophilaceae bacterium]
MTHLLVRLVTLDLGLLDAAIAGPALLEREVGGEVAQGWNVFPEELRLTREAVAADPQSTSWGPRLFVLDVPHVVVGWGGFKGSPRNGVVELGYAVAPAWQGRGVGTAAVHALLRQAWAAADVQTVLAHTLAGPGASVRVLEKTGFRHDGEIYDDEVGATWRFRLDRVDT